MVDNKSFIWHNNDEIYTGNQAYTQKHNQIERQIDRKIDR